jgi:ABC-2 type transport system ATP-binding protein
MALIEVQHLHKSWRKDKPALDDVSFEVGYGQIVGLLGHNGAGKSTVLGITLGMVRPDGGEVRIGGQSVQKNRAKALQQIGAIFEAPVFYDYLSGWQNLRALCSLSGWWDEKEARRVLKLVNLHDRADATTATYSHGMKQRLALAQALLPRPRCLLLDEPTDGLDPEGIREFREFILKLKNEFGMTILLNSHLLSEVELMCDRCIILKQGRKLYEGPVPSRSDQPPKFQLTTPDMDTARAVAARSGVTIHQDGAVDLPPDILGHEFVKRLVEAGVRVEGWQQQRRTLEDSYLELTGIS